MKSSVVILAAYLALLSWSATAGETNLAPPAVPPSPSAPAQNSKFGYLSAEQIRAACINGRRQICGRVVQIVPQGLVVDSGYTNLMRPELKGAWLVRSTVSASRPPHLVEANTPDTLAVGLVFVTDIPKRPAVKPFDYVVLEGYPAGEYAYAPVPNVKKPIRRFSAKLPKAVSLNLAGDRK